jgi:hypothetical protein
VRPSVRAAFYDVNAPWEGVVSHMYADVKGLVTCGVGNLIDPLPFATTLPWVRKDSSLPASLDEVRADWEAVKHGKDMARLGHRAAARVTRLRLPDVAIRELVARKLDQNARHLRDRFADWDDMPADAQLAVLCLAWAVGPAFRWPMYEAAMRAANYLLAAAETRLDERGNPGVAPRNEGMRQMLYNAASVVSAGLDRDALVYGRRVEASESERPTEPQVPDAVESEPVTEPDGGVSRWAATREAASGRGEGDA